MAANESGLFSFFNKSDKLNKIWNEFPYYSDIDKVALILDDYSRVAGE